MEGISLDFPSNADCAICGAQNTLLYQTDGPEGFPHLDMWVEFKVDIDIIGGVYLCENHYEEYANWLGHQ